MLSVETRRTNQAPLPSFVCVFGRSERPSALLRRPAVSNSLKRAA